MARFNRFLEFSPVLWFFAIGRRGQHDNSFTARVSPSADFDEEGRFTFPLHGMTAFPGTGHSDCSRWLPASTAAARSWKRPRSDERARKEALANGSSGIQLHAPRRRAAAPPDPIGPGVFEKWFVVRNTSGSEIRYLD